MNDLYNCIICNNEYTRKCDLIRHVKLVHDTTCTNYNEYLIKYLNVPHPKCLNCDNLVLIRRDKIFDMCSSCNKLRNNNKLSEIQTKLFSNSDYKTKVIDMRRETTLSKYGVSHISQLESVKDKKKSTALTRYGVNDVMQIPSIKNARLDSLVNNASEINDKRRNAWTDSLKLKSNNSRTETSLIRYGVTHTSKLTTVRNKIRERALNRYSNTDIQAKINHRVLSRYGVTNVSKLTSVKQSITQTSLRKFNSPHYLSSLYRRNREELLGRWLPLDKVNSFRLYHRKCTQLTNKNIKTLYNNWDGTCYYTGVKLITDKSKYNDPLYRTIDHKMSIYNGFKSGASPEQISNITNLCICSRLYNTSKGIK